MSTIVEIGQILEAAKGERPVSLAEIGRRMKAKRVRHSTLRATVDFLGQMGLVTLGSKGAQWSHTRDERFWKAAREGVHL